MEVTQKELAQLFGITPRRIRQLKDEQGIFELAPGSRKHDLKKCIDEWVTHKCSSQPYHRGTKDLESVKAEHENVKIQMDNWINK